MPRDLGAVYIRLSHQEETAESLDRQQADGVADVTQRGLTPILYREPAGARSGFYEKNRPAWKQLKKDLAENPRYGLVWVADLARASRNSATMLEFLSWLQTKDIQFVSQKEQFDFSTAAGRALVGVLAVFNQFYRDDISERKTRQQRARDKRIYASNVHPYGLSRSGKYPAIEWSTTPDFPNILLLAELYTAGYSCADIAKEMNARGITWISRKRERVRVSPYTLDTCIGSFERYAPFLDPTLYAAVISRRNQQATKASQSRRYKNPPLLLSHLLYCDLCGVLLVCTTNRVPSKSGERIVRRYLHRNIECAIGNRNYRTEPIEQQFFEQIETLCNLTPEEKDEYARALSDPPQHVQMEHRLERDRLLTKLANLEDAYLAGDMGELAQARPVYRKKKSEWESELAALPEPPPAPARVISYEMAYALYDAFAENVARLHTLAPYEANRLARSLVDKVRIDGEGKVRVELAGTSQTLERTKE